MIIIFLSFSISINIFLLIFIWFYHDHVVRRKYALPTSIGELTLSTYRSGTLEDGLYDDLINDSFGPLIWDDGPILDDVPVFGESSCASVSAGHGQEWRINQPASRPGSHADCINPNFLVASSSSDTIHEPHSASTNLSSLNNNAPIVLEDYPSEGIHNTPGPSPISYARSIHQLDIDSAPTQINIRNISSESDRSAGIGPSSAVLPAAVLSSPGHILCQYNGNKCRKEFSDAITLSDHINKCHRYPCQRGCNNMGFLSTRDQTRHHNSLLHCESSDTGSNEHYEQEYRCACSRYSHSRRDNYLRHLRTCELLEGGAYTCGNCGVERHEDQAHHLAHLDQCQKSRGRKRQTDINE